MQQLELKNESLGETNFVGKMITRGKPQRLKIIRASGVYFTKNVEVKTLNLKNRKKLQYRKCNK
jgi:hypothetical protein